MEPGIALPHTNEKEQRRRRRFDQQYAVFKVGGTVYRELRYGFEKWSESAFPDMFGVSEDGTEGTVGSDENPIELLGCTTDEFDSLLEVIYATDDLAATLGKDEWLGVLKLARLFDMPLLAVMAVDNLSPDLSPAEKIAVGKASAQRVAQWVKEGYAAIIGDWREMTLEGLVADVGWEATARMLWGLKQACFEYHPSLANLSAGEIIEKIMEEEFGQEEPVETEAARDSTYVGAIPSLLRTVVTQEQPVPRRAGAASIISFAPDGVYVSRDYTQAPTRVLQDLGYDLGWRAEKHVRLVGDTTGRGLSDIIGFGDAGVYVSKNNGDGTFTPAKLVLKDFGYNHGWRVDKHVRYVVDLRKKGFVDIIGFGDGGVYVALNRGNGRFSSPRIVLPEFGYDAGGWNLDHHLRFLADVTGNGFPDIIGFGEAAVSVALNNGDGTFQSSKVAVQGFTPGAGGWLIEKHPRTIADVTGDGRVDIIGFFDDGVYIALNAGDGTFHPPTNVLQAFHALSGWRIGVCPRFVADTTGDGRGDIVGFGGHLCVSTNNGGGTFKVSRTVIQSVNHSATFPSETYLWMPVDLTGGGAADIIGIGKNSVWVAYNDGKGDFGSLHRLKDSSPGDDDKTVHWVTNLYA